MGLSLGQLQNDYLSSNKVWRERTHSPRGARGGRSRAGTRLLSAEIRTEPQRPRGIYKQNSPERDRNGICEALGPYRAVPMGTLQWRLCGRGTAPPVDGFMGTQNVYKEMQISYGRGRAPKGAGRGYRDRGSLKDPTDGEGRPKAEQNLYWGASYGMYYGAHHTPEQGLLGSSVGQSISQQSQPLRDL